MLRHRILAIELALGLTLGVAGAEAQGMRGAPAPVTEIPNAAADRLRQRAESLYGVPAKLRDAAALHEREATLRGPSDPQAVDALEQAARFYTYAGDPSRGRAVMQKAADRALRSGEVLKAAHAYIDAAFMALREHDVERAYTLTNQADLISHSPHLVAADRLG